MALRESSKRQPRDGLLGKHLQPEFGRLGLEALAPGLAVVVGRRVIERNDLAALRKQRRHIFAGLFAALLVVGDDQTDVFARPDADVGDDDRNVLGVENRLDRLSDHNAVTGEDEHAVDLLSAEVLQIGDLLGLVVIAAVRDDQVDVDAFRLPLVRRPFWRR